MIGPCLCGDPYCPFCGNPAQAAFEEIVEAQIERFENEVAPLCESEGDFNVFFQAGLSALKAHKTVKDEAIKNYIDEERISSEQHIQQLKDEILTLREVLCRR